MGSTGTNSILDLHIRRALRQMLEVEHAAEPDCLIVDEMAVAQHAARADIGVINGSLSAYEIKSDRDSLQRLRSQLSVYLECFDYVTVACTSRHMRGVRAAAPPRVGILRFDPSGNRGFETVRIAKPNRRLRAESLVGFLWRDEAYAILRRHGLASGLSSARKHLLYALLVKHLDTTTIAAEVRWAFKQRGDWRVAARRKSGDDSSRKRANKSSSQARAVFSRPLRSSRRPS